MNAYQIIDEPKPGIGEHFIVDPIVILFASLLVPLFFTLPFLGRLWIPLVWIVANGYLLGSPTNGKETLIAIAGVLVYLLIYAGLIGAVYYDNDFVQLLNPYIRILIQANLFFTLYLIVFYQSAPYAIYRYVREQSEN